MSPLQRKPSVSGPTVLIRPDGSPVNALAQALVEAFGTDRISDEAAERLRREKINVEVEEPRPIYRLFKGGQV